MMGPLHFLISLFVLRRTGRLRNRNSDLYATVSRNLTIEMRERDLLILVTVIIAMLAIVSLTAGGGMGYMMGPWMMGGGGWMGLSMIAFWILIGVGVYLLFAGYTLPRRDENERALMIAKERYARGEITHEEYEEIKRNLSQT